MRRTELAGVLWLLFTAGCGSEARPAPHPRAVAPVVENVDGGRPTSSANANANTSSPASPFTDLLMTEAACTSPSAPAITRADALADVATVERIVRRGWAGYETMTRAGADFDATFADVRSWLASAAEPIAVDDLKARLVSALRPAHDSHMAFFAFAPNGSWARRESVALHERAFTADLVVDHTKIISGPAGVPAKARLVSCEGHELQSLLRPTVTDRLVPAQRPIVLSETQPAPLRCRISADAGANTMQEITLPMRPLRLGTKQALTSAPFVMREQDTPVLSLRTFWNAKQTELERFVGTAPSLRGRRAIIVDVRHNGGGSDDYAARWFTALTAGTIATNRIERLDSEVTKQGIFNDNFCGLVQLRASEVPDPVAAKNFSERVEWARREVDVAERSGQLFRAWRERLASVEGKAPKPFDAPLVILTDHQCASACESFITMATGLPRTIVVGENSGGVGVFGEVLTYRLPKSGIGMSAGMKHFHADDPSRDILEGRGYPPDLWLDTDDALGLTERITACLTKSSCPLAASVGRRTR